MESKLTFKPINAVRCCFGGLLGGVVSFLFDWLLMLASSLYLEVYVCQHALKQVNNLRSRARCLPLFKYKGDDIQLTITLMSGRSEEVRAKHSWSIHDMKEWLAANMWRESTGATPANQIRLFDGCRELCDDAPIDHSMCTQLSLIVRSRECAEWLDKLHQGSFCDLKSASESVRRSKECVLAAAHLSGLQTLQQVPQFQDDDDVVMAAVQNDGLALSAASFRLRTDTAIALLAVGRDRESLVTVCEPLRSDPEFLRRAYWVSTLDCKPLDRLSQNEGGNFQTWEDVLYGARSTLKVMLWSTLHQRLRERNPAFHMLSTVGSILLPILVGRQMEGAFFGHPFWGIMIICMAVILLGSFILKGMVANMLVDFVMLIAGPLTNPRRSSCRCCCK